MHYQYTQFHGQQEKRLLSQNQGQQNDLDAAALRIEGQLLQKLAHTNVQGPNSSQETPQTVAVRETVARTNNIQKQIASIPPDEFSAVQAAIDEHHEAAIQQESIELERTEQS